MSIAPAWLRSSAPGYGILAAAGRFASTTERMATALGLLAMAVLPVLELALRALFGLGIPGSAFYVTNLTLWVGFLGAAVAAGRGAHLSLTATLSPVFARIGLRPDAITGAVTTLVAACLAWAGFRFVASGTLAPTLFDDWLPEWVVHTILPIAFATIAVRSWRGSDEAGRITALAALVVAAALAGLGSLPGWVSIPVIAVLITATLLGAPIFVLLGGSSLVLFATAGIPVAAQMAETYRIIVSPAIAMVPLFTLTGYLLAQGRTTDRLVRLFDAWFGWLPGGTAIATVLLCSFFSAFTGASGVTILAVGGILLPLLLKNGYPRRYALGLLTSTGSIGLLFPPSLAVIVYGVVAHVSIADLFVAGLGPGAAMVATLAASGVAVAIRTGVPRPRFDSGEALAALWAARWEAMLPMVTLFALFGGWCSLPEAAAITAVYALVIQTLIHREIRPLCDLPPILLSCATVIGSIFIILGTAVGLTSYLVDAEIPTRAAEWIHDRIATPALFLLVLNLALLLVGCLMDVFSASAVVVPILVPMAEVYGIHPLHLAMIFLTNLELGYLTPPVGLNLFLASIRFGQPVPTICRGVLPFLAILACVVLGVTYAPLLGLVPAWAIR